MIFPIIHCSRKIFLILLVGGCISLWPLPMVSAQSSSEDLARHNLKTFAEAFKEITQIQTSYKQRILQSEVPLHIDSLQEEANQKMNEAVSNHGLTVEKYNTIFNTIEKNPNLKEELITLLRQPQ
jgi:GTP1/Obg family GTP-binding protein